MIKIIFINYGFKFKIKIIINYHSFDYFKKNFKTGVIRYDFSGCLCIKMERFSLWFVFFNKKNGLFVVKALQIKNEGAKFWIDIRMVLQVTYPLEYGLTFDVYSSSTCNKVIIPWCEFYKDPFSKFQRLNRVIYF